MLLAALSVACGPLVASAHAAENNVYVHEIEGISTLVANDSRAHTQFTVSPTPHDDVFDFYDCKGDVLNVETKGGSDLVTVTGGVYGELDIDRGATHALLRQ